MLEKNSIIRKPITKIKLHLKYETTVNPNSNRKSASFKKKNAMNFKQEPE